jgi:hypothetical protein
MNSAEEVLYALGGRGEPGGSGLKLLPLLGASVITWIHPLDAFVDGGGGWGSPAVSLKRWSVTSTGTGAQRVVFPIFLPHIDRGSGVADHLVPRVHGTPDGGHLAWYIDGLRVTWRGAPGHSVLPSGMPKVHLYAPDGDGGVALVSFTDDSVSVGSYEVLHEDHLDLAGSEILTQPGAHTVEVECESLSNAESGVTLWSVGVSTRLGLAL